MTNNQNGAKYILSIDQGTTSTRALIFDNHGHVVKCAQKELAIITPKSGWVEQDANDIWQDTVAVCNDVLKGFDHSISSVGITNQRETTILWDKHTGKPVFNAIVWQDRRTSEWCKTLKNEGKEDKVAKVTGLLLDPYFSASKIAWILKQNDALRVSAEKGDILFGTVECYLIWKLSNGKAHKTDISNASRTLLMDVERGEWSDYMCDLFDIPQSMLPQICENTDHFADIETAEISALKGVSVHGCAGDQQAALFGQACFDVGMIKSTYGTGCFALMNMGHKCVRSKNKLLSTVAWKIKGEVTFALEGAIFVAGAAVQFLRDNMGLFEDAAQTESMASDLASTEGVYFVPALTGLGAPYWDPDARGAIFGLSRGTSIAHLVKAALDAQSYQTQDLLTAMADDVGAELKEIRVDGGLTVNHYVVQKIADITGLDIKTPRNKEATAWGAAALAGLGAGVFTSLDDIEKLWQKTECYTPKISKEERELEYASWKHVVKRLID